MFKTVREKVLLSAGLLIASAHTLAQESPAKDAMTSIKNEATALINDAWPILVAVVVAGIGMKLFRRFAGKST